MFNNLEQAIYDSSLLEYTHGQGMALDEAEKLAYNDATSRTLTLPPASPRAYDINEMPWPTEPPASE